MAEVETYYVHPNWAWQKGKPSEKWIDKRCLEYVAKADYADAYAAGRRAGLREAAGVVEDDCYIDGGELLPDYEHRCKHNVNQKELAAKLRFRAQQIEAQAQGGGQ